MPGLLHNHRAFSIIGLLITMACMLVLSVILLTALDKAVTGSGSTTAGSVRSFEDQFNLSQFYQVILVAAQENRDRFPAPAMTGGRNDASLNTTANFSSLLVAQHSVMPKMLVSRNEHSPYVLEKSDYDFTAYNPAAKLYWDPTFKADLKRESNTSFAHMALYGERYRRFWERVGGQGYNSMFPLIGNRGPLDGRDNPASYTYGKDGTWAGFAAFADGHVDFIDTFTPNGLVFESRDGMKPDNIFAIEDGPTGTDAILTFTSKINSDGPVVQHD